MSRLFQGMYVQEVDETCQLFGLKDGQFHGDELTHNSPWFNAQGERLGAGDLNAQDMQRISRGLRPGEIFVVLSESAGLLNLYHPEHISQELIDDNTFDLFFPGQKYIAATCEYVITGGGQVYVVMSRLPEDGKRVTTKYGFAMPILLRDEVLPLLQTAKKAKKPAFMMPRRRQLLRDLRLFEALRKFAWW